MRANTQSRFGAVLEEFEVRDALGAVLSGKDSLPASVDQDFSTEYFSQAVVA